MQKHTENPKPAGCSSLVVVRAVRMSVPYDCAQLQYAVRHGNGSDNLHSYPQETIITAQMLTTGRQMGYGV